MSTPTAEAIIGTFINGRSSNLDFLQLKDNHGGNIFAWIDYQGKFQGAFATSAAPGGSNTDVQFNNNGALGGDSGFTYTPSSQTLAIAGMDVINIPTASVFVAPTVIPAVSGSTTWSYIVVAKYFSGIIINSLVGSTAVGTVSLSGVDYNTITWTAVPGATGYDVYRVFPVFAAGATGYIGSTTALTFKDTGQSVIGPSQSDTSADNTAFPNMGGYSEFKGIQIGDDFNTFAASEVLSGSSWAQLGIGLDSGFTAQQYIFNTTKPNALIILSQSAGIYCDTLGTAGGLTVAIEGIGLDGSTGVSGSFAFGGSFSGGSVGTSSITLAAGISAEFDLENSAVVTDAMGVRVTTPVIIAPALFQNITNYTGVFVDDPWGLGPAGTRPTNVYGVRVNAYSGGHATDSNTWGLYIDNANNYFGGGSSTTNTLNNPTAATNILNQNSPSLLFTGQSWITVPSPQSETTTFAIQNLNGILQFSQTVGTSPSPFPIQFNAQVLFNNTVQLNVTNFAFGTGNGGSVYVVSSAATASGSTTTYTVNTIAPAGQPVIGQNITIAGFVAHASNNGYFVVAPGGDSTHIVVYNASGVAETHTATATLDQNYDSPAIGQYSAQLGIISANTFPIAGTNYIPNNVFGAYPNSPLFVMNVKGESQDAAYIRILNDGTTGNHGLEIGGIVDSTGAAPVTFQLGHFNGVSSAVLNVPITIKGATPTGTTGQLSFGTTTGVGNGAGTNLQAPAHSTGTEPSTLTAVLWNEIDIAGTKYWYPLYQ